MNKFVSLIAIGAAVAMSSSAFASPVMSSAADAASVNLSVADTVKADVKLAPVSGTAPPSYNNNATLLTINEGVSLFTGLVSGNEGLTTGVVHSHAASAGVTSATGSTDIDNAGFGLTSSLLNALPLVGLGLSADTITSTTTAGINSSGLYAFGDSTIENLGLQGSILAGLGIDVSLFADPNPNTSLLVLPGLKIVLNEQSTTQTADSISMFTNAIHVSLNDYLFQGKLLNGDVILGHSEASVTGYAGAVPEPATWALMILGFGVAGQSLRTARRREQTALA